MFVIYIKISRDAKSGRRGRYICAIFLKLMLFFQKATSKTMQAQVPPAPVLHSSSANNASAISNSELSISVISASATQY